MISVRKSKDRGNINHGWLDAHHSFSFGEYHDPNFMGFGALRVINEDHISKSGGFPTHPHHDMEILTYVVSGAIAHKDSMGSDTVIPAGDVQIMSAGTGVTHSEFNPSDTEPIHLLQIWILPQQTGLPPRYAQKSFTVKDKENRLLTVASQNGDGMKIFQDVTLMSSILSPKKNCYTRL
jgi:redox-sensitive bicupin YhaK (pirin superfamily)